MSVRIHYRTLGTLQRDTQGRARNAVLILHGTGGTGAQFLQPQFAGELFGAGQLLDTSKYFVILPDNIGHGASSRPSDGLRQRFPKYGYADMVALQYRLVTEHLKIDHLRLVMGTSMGGMHTWMWATRYPSFSDGWVPMASVPTAIVGRNRMWRTMLADAITGDPAWKGGDYEAQPVLGISNALRLQSIMSSVPLQWHQLAPTREQADAFIRTFVSSRLPALDANDMLYQFDASRDYDPSADLAKITGAAAGHQLRRRPDQSARARPHGGPDAEGGGRTLPPDPDLTCVARAQFAHVGRALEEGTGRVPGAVSRPGSVWYDDYWQQRIEQKQVTSAELQFALRHHVNVVREFLVTLRVVKAVASRP